MTVIHRVIIEGDDYSMHAENHYGSYSRGWLADYMAWKVAEFSRGATEELRFSPSVWALPLDPRAGVRDGYWWSKFGHTTWTEPEELDIYGFNGRRDRA